MPCHSLWPWHSCEGLHGSSLWDHFLFRVFVFFWILVAWLHSGYYYFWNNEILYQESKQQQKSKCSADKNDHVQTTKSIFSTSIYVPVRQNSIYMAVIDVYWAWMISVLRSDDVVQNSSAVFETQTLKKILFHFLSTAAADRHFSSHTPSLSFCHTHIHLFIETRLYHSHRQTVM